MTTTLIEVTADQLSANPENLRSAMDGNALNELALSIASNGLLEPLIVRANGSEGSYELVAGHRRLAAITKLIEKGTVEAGEVWPAVVTDLDDAAVTVAMLVENLQREDLSPVDEALGYLRLTGFEMSTRDIAKAVGRSSKHVTTRLRIAGLPKKARAWVAKGSVTIERALDMADLVELGGTITDEMEHSHWYVTGTIKDLQVAKVRDALEADGIEVLDDRSQLHQLERVEPVDGEPLPEGTLAVVEAGYDGEVRTRYVKAPEAKPEKAGLSEDEKRERRINKARREHDQAEAQRICSEVTSATLNKVLLLFVRNELLSTHGLTTKIGELLDIDPVVTVEQGYDGKDRKVKDYLTPVVAEFDRGGKARNAIVAAWAQVTWTAKKALDEYHPRVEFDASAVE